MAVKIQDVVNTATKGYAGGFWDVVSGQAALRDLRRQYAKSLSFVDPNVGIPDQIEDAYKNALKRGMKKLWAGVMKVAASGFGKGVLLTVGAVLLGAAVSFGVAAAVGLPAAFGVALTVPGEAVTAGMAMTAGQAVNLGLIHAGNFLLSSNGAGLGVMALGGVVGAVSDVRKHHNRLSAQIAAAEAADYARLREENLAKEIQMLQDAAMKEAPAKEAQAKVFTPPPEKENPFTTREMLKRAAQAENPYRGL